MRASLLKLLVFAASVALSLSQPAAGSDGWRFERAQSLRGVVIKRESKSDSSTATSSSAASSGSLNTLIHSAVSNGLRRLSMLVPLAEVVSDPYLTSTDSPQALGITDYGKHQLITCLQEIMKVVDWMSGVLAAEENRTAGEVLVEDDDDDDDKDDDDYSFKGFYAFGMAKDESAFEQVDDEDDDDVMDSLAGDKATWPDMVHVEYDDDFYQYDDVYDDDADDDEVWYESLELSEGKAQ
eukprot:gene35325-42805_t